MALGIALQNILQQGSQPLGGYRGIAPEAVPTPQIEKKPGFFGDGGMGRYLAGLIGDSLLQSTGHQAVFAPMQQQRQQSQDEEVKWQRQRQQNNDDWLQRQQYESAHKPDDAFTAMVRASGVDPHSRAGQALYTQRIQHETAEPDVVVTLPNGQLYIGPKSGIGSALGGGASTTPTAPVGGLTPISGGPTQPASGTFR
jgi:hypothetical protein